MPQAIKTSPVLVWTLQKFIFGRICETSKLHRLNYTKKYHLNNTDKLQLAETVGEYRRARKIKIIIYLGVIESV